MSFLTGSFSHPNLEIYCMDGETPLDEIAAAVDRLREQGGGGAALTELLAPQHKLYSGRGANQVSRIRGYIISSFEKSGLPDMALYYVLEELENSRHAYLTAASARAIRGMGSPRALVAPYLQKAIYNIGHMDDALDLDSLKPAYPLVRPTMAVTEILLTLEWLGSQARDMLPLLHDMLRGRLVRLDESLRERVRETICRDRE